MKKKSPPTAQIFSHILFIEDLLSAIQEGTLTQKELVENLEKLHKELCLLVSDPSIIHLNKENTPNAS